MSYMVSQRLRRELAAAMGAGLVGFSAAAVPAAVDAVDWGIKTAENGYNALRHVPPAQWAAILDGTSTYDASAGVAAAITAADAQGMALYTPGKRWYFNGAQLSVSGLAYGDGRKVTKWVFSGAPVKTIKTRVVWRAEYDAGDYTSNSDAPVAAAVTLAAQGAELRNLTIITDHDATVNYPLPFNSATDFPTSNYEFGVLVQGPLRAVHSISVEGVWNTAALCLDGSNVGGFGDGFEAANSTFSGMWGVRVLGPQGQPISGDDYQDLNASDTRGSAGLSDVVFNGCKIYDTSGTLRLTINGVANKLVRRSATGGALYISGQVAANSSKRIQGIHFNNCRLACCDRYVFFINYANRVRLTNCHTEYRAGGYNTDGVTLLTAADCEIKNTANARRLVFMGGERSGETDNRTFKNTALNIPIISEIAFDDPDPPGSVPAASMLRIDGLRDRGSTTEALDATNLIGSGGGAAVGTFTSTYWRIGNEVTEVIRVVLSGVGTIAGNLSVRTRFTNSNNWGADFDVANVVASANVATGDAGMMALQANGSAAALLYKVRTAANIQNVTAADLAATSSFWIKLHYMTEDA